MLASSQSRNAIQAPRCGQYRSPRLPSRKVAIRIHLAPSQRVARPDARCAGASTRRRNAMLNLRFLSSGLTEPKDQGRAGSRPQGSDEVILDA